MKKIALLGLLLLWVTSSLFCNPGTGDQALPAGDQEDNAADVSDFGCPPGKVKECPCIGGGSGVQTCSEDGIRWGKCEGCPSIEDGSSSDDAAMQDGALIDAGEFDSGTDGGICQANLEKKCCNDGMGVCWFDSCGQQGAKTATCQYGCSQGICNACAPICEGKECGDDGCGGDCASCSGRKVCENSKCICKEKSKADCCGVATCWFDSCGNQGDKIADCPAGCANGKCNCAADCNGKECGDNGCGGTCAACSGGEQCQNFKCVCLPNAKHDCCNSNTAVCYFDSCGVQGSQVKTCPDGCSGGSCICKTNCGGKQCGNDGCGSTCGTCTGGKQCQNDQCVCVLNAKKDCVGNSVYWFDSCNVKGSKVADCPQGCFAGACTSPCSSCTGGQVCQNGSCVCVPYYSLGCCGTAVCSYDSCGKQGSVVKACTGSCVAGICDCTFTCSGKQCGSDLCGGSCGVCAQTQMCQQMAPNKCTSDCYWDFTVSNSNGSSFRVQSWTAEIATCSSSVSGAIGILNSYNLSWTAEGSFSDSGIGITVYWSSSQPLAPNQTYVLNNDSILPDLVISLIQMKPDIDGTYQTSYSGSALTLRTGAFALQPNGQFALTIDAGSYAATSDGKIVYVNGHIGGTFKQ